MPIATHKKPHICKRCKTRFRGQYCPYCGAEYGAHQLSTGGGILLGLLRFVFTLVILCVVLAVAIAILDSTAYAHDPANASVYAILSSIRNAVPPNALAVYDSVREKALSALKIAFTAVRDFFAEVFS
ncbi:MAG TPA: hypothetical protein VN417_03980 [Candidatus Cryosericum sp.]|nr:hypothetical protein [Candidatus Cryosericum sp.]